MNSYSLTADSRRWWWLPTTAGALGAAAVTAILVLPATGIASVPAPPSTEVGETGVTVERPCYLARRGWNTARGWDQPVCGTELRRPVAPAARPAPDYLP